MHNILIKSIKESFVFHWFDKTGELLKTLDTGLDDKEVKKINEFQKRANRYKNSSKKAIQKLNLEEYFEDNLSKKERNEQILKVLKDDFTGSEIARYLGLSPSGISRIVKKSKVKPRPLMPSNHYEFVIHGYTILDNHYHLLLENKRENLSHGMRQINATYAQYFNKKYKREFCFSLV